MLTLIRRNVDFPGLCNDVSNPWSERIIVDGPLCRRNVARAASTTSKVPSEGASAVHGRFVVDGAKRPLHARFRG
ncbi:hypothetical protein [Burkholderia territorii]|uniref:hypothetical protein n=1 Tax=Burkholderia territorii TaxID=1503055 RepID=UPI000AB5B8E8|nr:hypothetical protein [Burkholderia territorii]